MFSNKWKLEISAIAKKGKIKMQSISKQRRCFWLSRKVLSLAFLLDRLARVLFTNMNLYLDRSSTINQGLTKDLGISHDNTEHWWELIIIFLMLFLGWSPGPEYKFWGHLYPLVGVTCSDFLLVQCSVSLSKISFR